MKFQAKLIGFVFLQELVCDKENTWFNPSFPAVCEFFFFFSSLKLCIGFGNISKILSLYMLVQVMLIEKAESMSSWFWGYLGHSSAYTLFSHQKIDFEKY